MISALGIVMVGTGVGLVWSAVRNVDFIAEVVAALGGGPRPKPSASSGGPAASSLPASPADGADPATGTGGYGGGSGGGGSW